MKAAWSRRLRSLFTWRSDGMPPLPPPPPPWRGTDPLRFTQPMRIAVHELHPNDVLILRTARPLSRQQAVVLRDLLEDRFPGHQVLVLERGLSFEVIRPTRDDTQ
jgi:hypothetical protein